MYAAAARQALLLNGSGQVAVPEGGSDRPLSSKDSQQFFLSYRSLNRVTKRRNGSRSRTGNGAKPNRAGESPAPPCGPPVSGPRLKMLAHALAGAPSAPAETAWLLLCLSRAAAGACRPSFSQKCPQMSHRKRSGKRILRERVPGRLAVRAFRDTPCSSTSTPQ